MTHHPFDLTGKRAIVTGAGQGIGRASAEAFRDAGADVLALDRNPAALEGLPGCRTAVLDVTDAAAITALTAQEDGFDIVFNCAGVVHGGTILDCSDEDWAFAFDLNVTAMFRLIRALLPGMIARGGGSIINMASVAGSVIGVPNRFAYGASKAAVVGLTKAVAADFVQQGIRCNAICPGTVHSPSLEQRLAATGDFDAAMAAFKARQPMGRIGDPAEIAALALYLASDAAAFTTGQCQIIDGGWANS
ncbi:MULTISPECIES: SDR family oxidoreductase [unclassified Novosphingobium]|uniref:SDR family oxidoreductase n=1 Tax=unclassified Novosphingobium TaxID=2644732 RepID=UPI001493FF26|nr:MULTISPECIES: SDR family oxidoreductase [unclassified Novosphingobium]MBB3356637.1 2-keto-3-deoxy-L-fuconate dehydrogenase [Novosphingobium sp. BK256]MBB3373038.1 2-keto-3-deoxy-L-fuconate dehydrogenase [Novosphingobium sp. BK280]MBB3377406.1 2-keto-3-deoxy-L-fuconate dehydrogenase [Novosphingobium sp. BK258]MBB3419183.1 2-keto-3-deoxy-L-fuconate dehydrogenase [Novosphingobium sp. BK267]MBB3449000.1 2-keto-3-deoxy-L-fuconate dehydrogenase [Novosphingobium sp. BK352]